MYVIDDIWIYIKEYLFHNIKYSKHLGDDKYIKEYNLILKKFPDIMIIRYVQRLYITKIKI